MPEEIKPIEAEVVELEVTGSQDPVDHLHNALDYAKAAVLSFLLAMEQLLPEFDSVKDSSRK